MKINEEAQEILEEISKEEDIDIDSLILPPHKVNSLYNNLEEEDFKSHMKESLSVVE